MSTAIDVDSVVRAVLDELARRNGQPKRDDVKGQVFPGRLLGQAQVEAWDGTVEEIRVAKGTVVTPLALDLMKRRGISLRYAANGEATEVKAKGTGEWAFAIEGPASGKAEAIRRTLLDAWAEVAAPDASYWVLSGTDRGALVLTPEASVAAWRANRVEGVRAATACDVDSVSRAVKHLGVNVLVIEPALHSIPSMKAMAEAFRRGGAPTLPEGLR
jgi:hypothetical protein